MSLPEKKSIKKKEKKGDRLIFSENVLYFL